MMFRRYRFWLWTSVVLLLLTALIHTSTLFLPPPNPQSDTERQLLHLLVSYKQDFGAGFHRTMKEIFVALSACFSLVCLLGGLTLLKMNRAEIDLRIFKSVVGIHVLVFGLCFFIMATHTFLPPIILTGLIFLSLLVAYFLIPRQQMRVTS